MPISEAERSDLYTRFTEVFGPSRTETLMSVIRIVGLHVELAEFRNEGSATLAEHRPEGSFGLAEFRGEVASLRSEMASMQALEL